ncbi:MAG: hypothetical protein V5A43_05775 [Haloarculaceae archaeon]
MHHDPLPTLSAGLTHLQVPHPRSTALHRVVVSELRERQGPVYWLDARNEACSYVLYELAPHHRLLDPVRVARAFTAYQHHTLVKRLVRRTSGRTAMLVAPNVGSLYEDDDVPDYEREALLEAALTMLREVGATHEVPVLVTSATADPATRETVAAAADQVVTAERTRMGLHFAGDGGGTTVYVEDGYWQTTIPYWVDLFGSVTSVERPTPATDLGPAVLSSYG